MAEWQDIKTAPVGPLIIVTNENEEKVFPAYGYWTDGIPFPRWLALEPEGMGRCKPTHWQLFPEPLKAKA